MNYNGNSDCIEFLYEVPTHTFLRDPQGSFVKVGKMHLSPAVFQKTELKLEAMCDLTTLLESGWMGLTPRPEAQAHTAYLLTPRCISC